MQNRQMLPIGIEDFKKIRERDYYYVDKTKLIEELLETGGAVSLFTRPRRFGKTLNMSMLKSFFEVGSDSSLFDGLYISSRKDLCEKYMGKYPVIFISLKGAEGRNYEEAAYSLIELVRSEVMRFSFLKDDEKLEDEEKASYKRLVFMCDVNLSSSLTQLKFSLKTLSKLLYKHLKLRT